MAVMFLLDATFYYNFCIVAINLLHYQSVELSLIDRTFFEDMQGF